MHGNLDAAFSEGGMNWGNVAIFTCSARCETESDCYVVVQESAEGTPTQHLRTIVDEPVVIADGTDFGADEEDDELEDEEDMEEMSEDEFSVDG